MSDSLVKLVNLVMEFGILLVGCLDLEASVAFCGSNHLFESLYFCLFGSIFLDKPCNLFLFLSRLSVYYFNLIVQSLDLVAKIGVLGLLFFKILLHML